jgi:dTMP kinase
VTSPRPLARGILVALEGIDGAGKSTQAKCLAAMFRERGYAVTSLREPTLSPWGQRLRAAMATGRRVLAPSQELDLFLQDRRYDVAAHLRPALAACQLVFLDRYYFSTMAYQGALGIEPESIRRLNETFAPVPDLVFILLIPPTAALQRIRQGRGQTADAFEREDYLERVDGIFRTLQGTYIHSIAADQSSEVVTSILREKIQQCLDANPWPPPSPQ